jgi:2'-hydroxyisoflavone reductase
MRILVLGGTQFLGRHVVEAALARGHDVTLFNRGRTRPELFPEAEKLHGDREGDLSALAGRAFDGVVDTSGYLPDTVSRTLEALGDVGHYTFVSTMSVYRPDQRTAGEEGEVETLPPPGEEPVGAQLYGANKALCEREVLARFPDAFVPRPGLIVGPWDPTGRFTYWPARIAAGGRVLAPEPRAQSVQVIDVRDLAAWIVAAAERGLGGTYNAVSRPFTLEHALETCRAVAESDATFEWVDGSFLLERDVGPWMELPLWVGDDPDDADLLRAPVERALAAGLEIRPLRETAADTLAWVRSGEAPIEPPAGLDREKERRLLEEWDAR